MPLRRDRAAVTRPASGPLARSARFSLAFVLATTIAVLVSVAILGVLAVQLIAARTNTLLLLNGIATLITRNIESGIEAHLQPARDQLAFLGRRFEDARYSAVEDVATEQLLVGALAAVPQVEVIGFIDAELRQVAVIQDDQRRVRVERISQSANPLVAQAIAQARQSGASFWGEPIFVRDKTYVNLRHPLRRDGEFVGMLFALVSVQELSLLVTEIGALHRATAFVLFGPDRVIAHPNLASRHPARTATTSVAAVGEIGDPVLPLLAGAKRAFGFDEAAQSGVEVLKVASPEAVYYVTLRWHDEYGKTAWAVGSWLAVEGEIEAIKRLRFAGLIGLGLLLVAIAVAIVLGKALSRPVQRIASASRKVGDFDLSAITSLPPSRVKEIDEQAAAFNSMVGGLAAFERYVPKLLVQRLVKLGLAGHVASEERQVTLLFTDITGFTSMSERLPPAEVAALLNRHFSLITSCIETEGGTIDKFIGDAVMAFWGAPEPQPDHALRACRAAQAIAQSLAAEHRASAASGGIPVRIRVGIHSGSVVVGNIGSTSRMNYTVIGDTVNTCQRIESLGKQFDRGEPVTILISGATVALAGDRMSFEPAGVGELRGRQEAVPIYRLVGENV